MSEFNPEQVTRSSPIKKRILFARLNNIVFLALQRRCAIQRKSVMVSVGHKLTFEQIATSTYYLIGTIP